VSAPISTVRVMTWNIHGGLGPDRRPDLRPAIGLVQRHDPDIVALQEVDSRRRNGSAERAFDVLAGALGKHSAAARVINAPDGDYGHVVISRWPLIDTRLHDISMPGREPRAAIEATVQTPFGPLHVVAVHLGLGVLERRKQAALLAALVRPEPACRTTLGDFNEWVWPHHLHRALAHLFPDRTRLKTYPAQFPFLRLDRIYCGPAGTLVRSWTDADARPMSDHLPVVADMSLVR
jgi:endonuclease/exonuclease/phosphatase family metal-dependent hydrolase